MSAFSGDTVRFRLLLIPLLLLACKLLSPSVDGSPSLSATATKKPTTSPTATQTANPTTQEPVETATPLGIASFSELNLSTISNQAIAFSAKVSGNQEIFVVDPDGSHLQQITHNPESNQACPRWSPDRDWLAFSSYIAGNDSPESNSLVLLNAREMTYQRIEFPGDTLANPCPIWSPDSSKVAINAGFPGFFLLNTNGEVLTQIRSYWPNPFHWSPNSTEIALANSSDGLAIITLDGEKRSLALPVSWSDMAPKDFAWSPDGQQLAYIDNTDALLGAANDPKGPWEIWLTDLTGSEPVQISPFNATIDFRNPKWIATDQVLVEGWLGAELERALYGLNINTTNLIEFSADLNVERYAVSPSHQWVALLDGQDFWLINLTDQQRYLITEIANLSALNPTGLQWLPDASHVLITLDTGFIAVDLNSGDQSLFKIEAEINQITSR